MRPRQSAVGPGPSWRARRSAASSVGKRTEASVGEILGIPDHALDHRGRPVAFY